MLYVFLRQRQQQRLHILVCMCDWFGLHACSYWFNRKLRALLLFSCVSCGYGVIRYLLTKSANRLSRLEARPDRQVCHPQRIFGCSRLWRTARTFGADTANSFGSRWTHPSGSQLPSPDKSLRIMFFSIRSSSAGTSWNCMIYDSMHKQTSRANLNVASSTLWQHDTLGATAIPAHCMYI